MNYKKTWISEDLYNLLNERKKHFGTSIQKESINLVNITRQVENQLGLDIKKVPIKEKINLNFKKKILILK